VKRNSCSPDCNLIHIYLEVRQPVSQLYEYPPCFLYPHTNIPRPRDKSTPGGDTYNTRSERMQCSKYEQEESQNIV
jgi:hypothetical protein